MTQTATDQPPGATPELCWAGVTAVVGDGTTERIAEFVDWLGTVDGRFGHDANLVDQLGLLEQVKGASAGAQARVTTVFESHQLAAQDARGVRADKRGRGIGDQVALARRAPASQGSRHLGFAKAVVKEMPHAHALLSKGLISEWVATILVRETAILSVEDRATVDERLCAMHVHPATGQVREPRVLDMTPRRVEGAARALVIELDPDAAVRRASRAAKHRKVTVRPAPDTMSYVSGFLPVAQGVACFASLDRDAKALKATGDPRSLDQIRADLFLMRLTGQTTADAVSAEIQVTISAEALAGATDQPGRVGDVPVPAQTIRDLADHPDAPTWIRRVVTDPVTGEVIDIDKARRRFHSDTDTRFTRARDQHCRQPWCDGGIGHIDHPHPAAEGGPSTRVNSQGLCEGHNYVKEMPGWSSRVIDDRPGHHTIEITTPTGHTYLSKAPPGLPPPL